MIQTVLEVLAIVKGDLVIIENGAICGAVPLFIMKMIWGGREITILSVIES